MNPDCWKKIKFIYKKLVLKKNKLLIYQKKKNYYNKN